MNETTATTSSPVPGETVRIPADDTPWPSPVAAWSALTVLVLTRALAVLQFGFIFGTGLASIVGGALLGHVAIWEPSRVGPILIRNWQWVLIMIGVPGLLIALALLLVKEPRRRGVLNEGQVIPFRQVFSEIHARRKV